MSGSLMTRSAAPRERRHTLYFLDEIRAFSPVFLDTDIDMTQVRAHRAAAFGRGHSYSTVTYILHSAARVLAAHPEANSAIRGHVNPRVARYDSVNGKLTLDKTLGDQRVVLATVLRDLHRASLDDIQRQVNRFRQCDPATMPEFAPARLLHRLPWVLGLRAFRLGVRPLERRADTMGTFAVTSLGHRCVNSFFSVGGTTITLGVGRVLDRPVACDGRVVIAPVLRLSLTFDHRVIDGAEAADVLTEIKDDLESFGNVVDLARPTLAHSEATEGPDE
jgi:pyruvate/2-oxoglutarate dehydrogenase complex dihydrolipoamide acyltransferase (E2) component